MKSRALVMTYIKYILISIYLINGYKFKKSLFNF